MQEIEVTFMRAATIWWAWIWRAVVVTVVTSSVVKWLLGELETAVMPVGWHPGNQAKLVLISRICGMAVGSLISILMLQRSLRLRFSNFHVVLVRHQDYYSEPF